MTPLAAGAREAALSDTTTLRSSVILPAPIAASLPPRHRGDRFWPLGAPGPKKLKEFLRERGIPQGQRDAHPLVLAGGRIIWVVGERISESVRVTEASSRCVRLVARRDPEPAD